MPKTINLTSCITHVKETMLGLSPDISCHKCDKNYCCMGQQWIEIAKREFEQIESLITEKQMARAKFQIENPIMKRGMTTYDCPFNDPTTGKCEIYDVRPMVCASYGVINPIEECDTNNEKSDGIMVVNPINVYSNISDNDTILYLTDISRNAEQTTIIDEFRRLLGL